VPSSVLLLSLLAYFASIAFSSLFSHSGFEEIRKDSFKIRGEQVDGIPDTTIPGAGYIDCNQASVCMEGGDRQYMMQAVVRSYLIPGSGKIRTPNATRRRRMHEKQNDEAPNDDYEYVPGDDDHLFARWP